MRKSFLVLLSAGAIAMSMLSCQNDIACSAIPTYNADIKDIMVTKCTLPACHTSGASNGDMTTFVKLKKYTDNGTFNREVLVNKSMPQGSVLTQEQIDLITCWKQNGYPEK